MSAGGRDSQHGSGAEPRPDSFDQLLREAARVSEVPVERAPLLGEPDLAPGQMLGGYRIERFVGAGGMGAVYAVVHPVIGKHAAAKVIHKQILSTPGAAERFVQEAQLVNRIRHPNLVDVFGFATAPDERPVLIMELLEGESLRDLLARRGALGASEAALLGQQVLEGLAAAHQAGVVHRDLKPENLFVAQGMAGQLVKILDFGIAKLLTPDRDAGSITTGHFVGGTPRYAAPEQMRGEVVDARADLYAFGVMLFEMLAGRPPFVGNTAAELVGQHLHAPPPAMSDVGAPTDPRLEQLVASLLAKDREVRPASAAVLWGELEALSLSHPGSATMSSMAGPALAAMAGASGLPASSGVPAPAVPGRAPPPGDAPMLRHGPALGAAGGPSDAAADQQTEENRVCTVLFVAVDGVGDLEQRLAPEERKQIVDAVLGKLTGSVEQQGGVIERILPDGFVAAFGAPRSTDNDPERAVLAGLGLQRAGKALPRAHGRRRVKVPLGVCIGIETGLLFVSQERRTGTDELSLVGEAVTVAEALSTSAEPNTVIVGASTSRHVAGLFALEPLAPVPLRGRRKPSPAYGLRGRADSAAESASHDFYGRPARFVGRKTDLARVAESLEQCIEDEQASALTVVAPPGLGKTRLRDQIQAELSARDEFVFVMAGRASSAAAGTYDLATSLLRCRFRIHADDPRDVVEQKLRAGIRYPRGYAAPESSSGGAESLTRAPAGARVFEPADLGGDFSVLLDLLCQEVGGQDLAATQDEAQSRVSSAVARLLGLIAMDAPVVLLCDAIESADDASLDLLDYLVARLEDSPVLVLAFARPALYDRRPHWGEGRDGHQRLDLKPLRKRPLTDIARDLLQRAEQVSDGFIGQLVNRAHGNPLVLTETVRMLVDAKAVDRDDADRWAVDEDRLEDLQLPASIYGLVQARLDKLSATERWAVQRAAVVGHTFWAGAVEARTVQPTPPSKHAGLSDTLAKLRSKQLVRARESSSFPGEQEFAFSDAITREVAYEALSLRAREQHHRAVAGWLEQRGGVVGEAHSALVALHHDRGGNEQQAFPYYVRAGRRASTLGQNGDALSHFERARDIVDDVSNSVTAMGADVDSSSIDSHDAVALRIELGDTLRRVGRLDDSAATYEEARDLLPVGPAAATKQALLDYRRGLVDKARRADSDALDHYQRAMSRLGDAGNVGLRASLLVEMGFARSRTGDLDGCHESCLEGLRLCRQLERTDRRRKYVVSRLLNTMGGVYYHRQNWLRTERFYRQAGKLAEQLGEPQLAAPAYNGLAAVQFHRGDIQRARDLFLRSLEVRERIGDLSALAVGCNNLAEVALELGDKQAAIDQLRRAVSLAETLGVGGPFADSYRNLAETLLDTGMVPAALRAAERAYELAQDEAGRAFLGGAGVALVKALTAGEETSDALGRARGVAETLENAGLADEASSCRELLGAAPE